MYSAIHQWPPDPQWSPEGKRIAFTGELPNAAPKIYLVPADGGTPPVEALSRDSCFLPSWSPDGTSLIFNCNLPPSKPEIYTLNLRTRQLSAIPESNNLYGPHFSPDGRSVVAHDRHQISLFDIGQQKWRTLATVELLEQAVWSRDGRYVYFVTGGNEESIYRLRIADRK